MYVYIYIYHNIGSYNIGSCHSRPPTFYLTYYVLQKNQNVNQKQNQACGLFQADATIMAVEVFSSDGVAPHTHIGTTAHTHTHVYIYITTHKQTHVYQFLYISIYLYIYIFIYLYIYIYIYT
eukprot:GHVR01105605.1.p1 GENE.GHVR01105605.1~~GHVR01105605.1.p1  ORF type:complete len:122 (-),score=29.66 GHVR01105605.1:73-438(-)